ncbi:hypothetical protein L917_04875 [Phytophthora nicotianae]|uniref:Uncharacterized protein n=1 Tax=Phytophthora nicotianae TaxID=4792 RepID=W2GUF7_PHYNI|nr:hypothetical protein L915_09365 [Phytophthora nicotianae]ETK91358.1 hypothetical protein L915_05029 [Phytophthora nicotianae]ETL44764.1 hypothetical protein L916_04980 [Phytophthora nicotianae]ETL97923.1 hypothetical protein L917_04875 [Phytophthora nicotianae]
MGGEISGPETVAEPMQEKLYYLTVQHAGACPVYYLLAKILETSEEANAIVVMLAFLWHAALIAETRELIESN